MEGGGGGWVRKRERIEQREYLCGGCGVMEVVMACVGGAGGGGSRSGRGDGGVALHEPLCLVVPLHGVYLSLRAARPRVSWAPGPGPCCVALGHRRQRMETCISDVFL